MRAEQKLILGCRQTSEGLHRLTAWLDHNPKLLGATQTAIRQDAMAQASVVATVTSAVETPPGIGLISTDSNAKTDLLFDLLGIASTTKVSELAQRPMEAAALRELLPTSGGHTASAIVRLTAGEPPPTPRGFPIRLGLLSMVDLAAILTSAHWSRSRQAQLARLSHDVGVFFADSHERISPQTLPGFTDLDVADLRCGLESKWPNDPYLTTLAATRYWEQLAEIAPHLPDRDRRAALAILWSNERGSTTIFNGLCDALEKLGQGTEAYCPVEGLRGKDKTSGWLTRHPASILDASILHDLTVTTGVALPIMNRYGQTVDLARATIAGVTSDVTLHITGSRLNDLAPAEIVDFPVPVRLGSSPQGVARPGDDHNPGDIESAIADFAREKSIYLFERACSKRQVTSLVVAVDTGVEDDTYAQAVGDWIDDTQGADARSRERVHRGLFIAAPRLDRRGNRVAAAQIAARVRDVIGGGDEWPHAWTPNRAFTDIFWFASDADEPRRMTAHSIMAQSGVPSPAALMGQAHCDLSQLVSGLMNAASPQAKQVQLSSALSGVRRRVRPVLLRHHSSNDPAALTVWRRRAALVAHDRLLYVIEQGRLGLLYRALLPTQGEILSLLETAVIEGSRLTHTSPAAAASPSAPSATALASGKDGETSSAFRRLADITMTHWFSRLRRGARSARLARELRLEPHVMATLIDECQIGAVRCAIADEIVSACEESHAARIRLHDKLDRFRDTDHDGVDLASFAAFAHRFINAYLEVLGRLPRRGQPGGVGAARSPSLELQVADGSPSVYGMGAPSKLAMRGPRASKPRMELSFLKLVEDNIASAYVLPARGDKDRELGEMIGLFAPGAFETD